MSWYWICLLIVLIILIMDIIASNYFISVALTRNKKIKHYKKELFKISKKAKEKKAQNKLEVVEWLNHSNPEEVKINSYGFKLDALYFNNNSHKWVILIHGYTGKKEEMLHLARWYYENGFSILVPDLRSHGSSEGKYYGMGYLDRLDILNWIKYITNNNKKAKIILHGHSMGAATTLFTAGENPNNLVGCISDCSYTSVYSVFKLQVKKIYKLPGHILIGFSNFLFRLKKDGYSMKKGNVLEFTKKIKVPVLFIHGTKDDLLPYTMCDELYEACQSKKEKVLFEGCGHAQSELEDSELFFDTIGKFIKKNIDFK